MRSNALLAILVQIGKGICALPLVLAVIFCQGCRDSALEVLHLCFDDSCSLKQAGLRINSAHSL